MQEVDDMIAAISAEDEHLRAINQCFVYFAALAETRWRRQKSDLFEVLPPGLATQCDDETASRLHDHIVDFVERCPSHPNVCSAFLVLLKLNARPNLDAYLISKLRHYCMQGDAHVVFQLCTVLEDLGMDVFRAEDGSFVLSRSYNEAEINLGVARRFLHRIDTPLAAS
jgi:hypothetical protein